MKWRLIFFDFEVKKDYWEVSFLENDKYITIDDKLTLIDYILKNKNDSIFIGYNNKHFDNWCLKCIWYGINPYEVVHHVIVNKEKPWTLPALRFKKNIDIITFDLMKAVGPMAQSLKEVEGNLGLAIITDKTIEEEKDQNLSKEEIETLIKYNKHDVFATKKLYDEIHYELDAVLTLIEYYNLPMSTLMKTKASILELIYKNQITKQVNPTTFNYKTPSFIHFEDDSVKKAIEAFEFTEDNKFDYDYQYDENIYKIGRGGAHYARKYKKVNLCSSKILICADYKSYYPSMMANPTNPELRYIDPVLDWHLFRGMIDLRFSKKGTDMDEPLKIPINGAYGKLIDSTSDLHFWPSGLSICLTGQLITVMIAQDLKKQNIGELANVNTDGFYYLVNNEEQLNKFMEIMKGYEKLTGINFDYDIIRNGIFSQKDVNNYVIANFDNKHIKVKGAMLNRFDGSRSWFQYSQAIVDEAVVNKIVYDIDLRETIMKAYNNNEARKFQIIYAMKGKNWEGCYYGKERIQSVNRGFATCDINKPAPTRLKAGTYWKFGDKPEHVIIYNDDLSGLDIRKIGLDIEWYVQLAQKRVDAFMK